MQKIRTATFEDLDAIAAVEAACFPAAEAATKEEFAGRLLRSQMSLMIRQESFMRNTTKILSNIIKTNMERKSK